MSRRYRIIGCNWMNKFEPPSHVSALTGAARCYDWLTSAVMLQYMLAGTKVLQSYRAHDT